MRTLRILHTEASPGWGGQEMRILREAQGMRARGHHLLFAVQEGGGLVSPLRAEGFTVYELSFTKKRAFKTFLALRQLLRREKIDLINTHSSLDSWIGGAAARLSGKKIVRTRHLSTPIRRGLNSYLLYNLLADRVVTTCQESAEKIAEQARLSPSYCLSIPTGIDPSGLIVDPAEAADFRKSLGVAPEECLVGTLCVLRGWKGVGDLLEAAKLLEHEPRLKWLVIGGGVGEEVLKQQRRALGLEDRVIFTGHLSDPFKALAALDIFMLLSWANEGVSQASLQAAYLKKPLITTPTGGLKEVCLEGVTGHLVERHAPQEVANAVSALLNAPQRGQKFGENAHQLVQQKFLLRETLDAMERIYNF